MLHFDNVLDVLGEEFKAEHKKNLDQILELIKDGELRAHQVQTQINVFKKNTALEVEDRNKLLSSLNDELAKANGVIEKNKERLASLRSSAETYITKVAEAKHVLVDKDLDSKVLKINEEYTNLVNKENSEYESYITKLEQELAQTQEANLNSIASFKQTNGALTTVSQKREFNELQSACDMKYAAVYERKIDLMKNHELTLRKLLQDKNTKLTDLYRAIFYVDLAKHVAVKELYVDSSKSSENSEFRKKLSWYKSKVNNVYFKEGNFEDNALEFQRDIDAYRSIGSNKIYILDDKIEKIKKSKDLSKDDLISDLNNLLTQREVANENFKVNKCFVEILSFEAINFVKIGNVVNVINTKYDKIINDKRAKDLRAKDSREADVLYFEQSEELAQKIKEDVNHENKASLDAMMNSIKLEYKSNLITAKEKEKRVLQGTKRNSYESFLHGQTLMTNYRNGKPSLEQSVEQKFKSYIYNFNFKNFILSNCIYLIIIVFYFICVGISPSLINGNTIITILGKSSVRLFYALGVAGLILLAGTDLSIGRMIGMGTLFTCFFLLGSEPYSIFGVTVNSYAWPWAVKLILALIVPIALTTLFSAFSGFFVAKFKMHPFISTLGTQLIIFGLFATITEYKATSLIDFSYRNITTFGTKSDLGIITFAIIATIIVWLIWNKTRFGKNLYAVGGNAEAAAVSGISVFKITMLAFVMAGVLYGIGTFFEGIKLGSASINTGNGYELDAIAACVVGGISFNGGVGKISGVVFGVILFELLSTAFTYIRLDPNLAFVMKGAIIIFAVTLDSLKYLKKK